MASQFLEKKNKSEVVGDTEKDIQARKSIMMAYEAFCQHLESNGGLGKNEDGEDFIEIEEVWNEDIPSTSLNEDDNIDTVQSTGRFAESAKGDEGTITGYSNDDDQDDNDVDGDFELLMQNMEAVELGEENATSSKEVSSGLLRGFLLQNKDKDVSVSVERNTGPPETAVPCKGTVVERMGESSLREESTTNLYKAQKHVSRFKQNRLLGRDHM